MSTAVPTVYTQVLRDVADEKTTDARYAGLLDPGRTTLNVQTAFTAKYDKQDTYRFRLTKDALIGVSAIPKSTDGTVSTKQINVQLLNRAGQVIADSTAKDGSKLKQAYDDLAASNFQGKKGDYYVRFSRGDGIKSTEAIAYNAQIRSGFSYKDDYTSVEKPPTAPTIYASAASLSNAAAAQTVASTVTSLLDSSNFFSKIQSFTYVDIST